VKISQDDLIDRYDAFLIDAYGVLVTSTGAVPGAADFLRRLDDGGKSWCVCTNDASRLPETSAQQYAQLLGRDFHAERVVTAGGLLSRWTLDNGWEGANAHVLGPWDSQVYAERAGLNLVEPEGAEVFVMGDESGFDLLSGLDESLTAIVSRIERGHRVGLVCPNDDIIYPKGDGGWGVAAGGFAGLLENCLDVRFPGRSFRFDRLGKPRPALFQEGLRRLGESVSTVMIGDTPATDVSGANDIGLDVVLFGDATPDPKKNREAPTWRLSTW
jgi:ribonucleotide monophosphatase NagD (HAD superfamily)